MRTSLNNIKTIEDYLLDYVSPDDALLFEANMILNSELADDVKHQQNTYAVIRQYGRRKIKAEIMAAQEKLRVAPEHQGLLQRIANLFKKD